MSSLYEINEKLLALTDKETGEIADESAFETLQMERDEKIENVALWYKNLLSDADQLSNEAKSLSERATVAKNKAERLKSYLVSALVGQKFTTTRVAISYRKSETVEIDDDAKLADEYLVAVEPRIDKAAIKNALKAGVAIDGARIEEHNNIQIK